MASCSPPRPLGSGRSWPSAGTGPRRAARRTACSHGNGPAGARPRTPGPRRRPRRGRPGRRHPWSRRGSRIRAHPLSRRAAWAIAASCTAVRVWISDWQSPDHVEPPVAGARPARAGDRRGNAAGTHRHGLGGPRNAGMSREPGAARRPLGALVRRDHVSPFPVTRFCPPKPFAQVFERTVFACSRIILTSAPAEPTRILPEPRARPPSAGTRPSSRR